MKTQIKICGLSNEASIDAAIAHGASHFGLVHFEKSPRHVSLDRAKQLRAYAGDRIKTVLLLVNADPKLTGKAITQVNPDILQFHGSETPEWIKLVRDKTGLEIWKAVGVRDHAGLSKTDRYIGAVDRLLFDAPAKALPGDPDNVTDALTATHAPLVDVSSGVESTPGVKQVDRIAAFCQAVRDYDTSN